jgi:hypothetical protein
MNKCHAGKSGFPLCGTKHKDRFHVVVLLPKDWNNTDDAKKCAKCVQAIRASKVPA